MGIFFLGGGLAEVDGEAGDEDVGEGVGDEGAEDFVVAVF